MPAEPAAALAWVTAVKDDGPALRARLDAWPRGADDEAFADDEASQIAWTWRLRLALQDGDVERAADLRSLLVDRFDGHGQYPAGRDLRPAALRFGVFEEALDEARRRIDGSRPDLARARDALAVAAHMLTPSDGADRRRLEATTAWVERATLADLLAAVGAAAPPHGGPTLLVVADDFGLGEGVFHEILKQWTRDHGERGLRSLLVPLLRGQVRVNLRLLPVSSRKEELTSIRRRAKDAGLTLSTAIAARAVRGLGLDVGDVVVLLADRKDRIVARLAGRQPDLRLLEAALQKLLSR